MSNSPNVSSTNTYNLQAYDYKANYESDNKSIDINKRSVTISNDEATYSESTLEMNASLKTYTPDMEKVKAMKEETEARLIDIMKKSIEKGFTKQANALQKVLDKLSGNKEGSSTEVSISINIEVSTVNVDEATEAEEVDDYWSAENTSDRFLELAKALSGGDPSKAELLKDAFIEGYKAAEELWGEALPQVSQDTYDLTLNKFDAWKNESSETVQPK